MARFVLGKDDKQVSFEPMGTKRVMVNGQLLDVQIAKERWRELRKQGYERIADPRQWHYPLTKRLKKLGWNRDWGGNPYQTLEWWEE